MHRLERGRARGVSVAEELSRSRRNDSAGQTGNCSPEQPHIVTGTRDPRSRFILLTRNTERPARKPAGVETRYHVISISPLRMVAPRRGAGTGIRLAGAGR